MTQDDPLREALREFMERTGTNERELSRLAQMNEKAVNQILTGKSRNPRLDTVAKLAQAIGREPFSLMAPPPSFSQSKARLEQRHRSVSPASADSPGVRIAELDVRPQAGWGSEMPALEGDGEHGVVAHWTIPTEYLRAFVTEPAAIRIVRVAGDSMEPEYPAGERVVVDTSHRAPSPPGVYVLWDGMGLVLKRLELVIGAGPRRVRLSSINPAYQPYEVPLEELHISGRVIGKWMWR